MREVYVVINLTTQQVDTLNDLMLRNDVMLQDLKKVELPLNLPARLVFTFERKDDEAPKSS